MVGQFLFFRDFFLMFSCGILRCVATVFCRYCMLSSCSALFGLMILSIICCTVFLSIGCLTRFVYAMSEVMMPSISRMLVVCCVAM